MRELTIQETQQISAGGISNGCYFTSIIAVGVTLGSGGWAAVGAWAWAYDTCVGFD